MVTVRYRDGSERRVVVETMGYADDGYRDRKRILHPHMKRAAGAVAVLEHDFHLPERWRQEWRDTRFKRVLWQSLTPAGAVDFRERMNAAQQGERRAQFSHLHLPAQGRSSE